ncbi:hypothetical protein [Streptomyces chiangmaiensis]|uniref:Uncharacterized protein n=1 Tax=Streptomyces chiangmaiensis TaxID=766497 RepID=A0ABU7FXI1_9ACTN|nr:hypothetical protein [Streptomyces chiangmaiensis]MED7828634.1 hypothetical protein [Streptomyces chiangmaiensis]
MRAVNDWQAESVPGFHRSARFADFDTIEAYQEWADFFVVSGRPFENGCSLGSLASEIVKTDLDVHDDLTPSSPNGGTSSERDSSGCNMPDHSTRRRIRRDSHTC